MAKQITKVFKVTAPGGQATPAPPLGPALGANGVNPGQFIQAFNERTKELNGKIVGCVITVFQDRTFEFEIKGLHAAATIHNHLDGNALCVRNRLFSTLLGPCECQNDAGEGQDF